MTRRHRKEEQLPATVDTSEYGLTVFCYSCISFAYSNLRAVDQDPQHIERFVENHAGCMHIDNFPPMLFFIQTADQADRHWKWAKKKRWEQRLEKNRS